MDAGKTETVLYARNCTGFVIQFIETRPWARDTGGKKYWRYIENGSSSLDYSYESFKDFKEFEESMRSYYCNQKYVKDATKPTTVKVKTGISSLDRELAGMRLGSLVIITGNSGAGKTLLADQIFRSVMNYNSNILWKNGDRQKHEWYSSFKAALEHGVEHQHLVVFDNFMTIDSFEDLSLLQGKLKNTRLIDWAILTMQTNRQSSALADYIFNIEKYSEGRFNIKCLKNRWGLNKYPRGINVKIKTTAHLAEV